MTRLGAAAVGLVLAGIGLLMVSPINDPDLWWLLAGGRAMVETRAILTTDPFSATAAGAPWVNHAWGFELGLYGVYRLWGTTGLIALQALFAVATFGLLYRVLRREGAGRPWALLLIALGAMATRGFWTPRPQLVTYLCLAAFWAALREDAAGGRSRLVWLVPLMLAWVNLHGGFAIGLALLGLVAAAEGLEWAFGRTSGAPHGRRAARVAGIGLACAAATLVNPFLLRGALFPFHVMDDEVSRSLITEWASLPFNQPQVLLLEGLIFLALVLLLAAPGFPRWADLAVLVVFVHLGLHAIRNTPLLVIVLVPILGRLGVEAAGALRATVRAATGRLGTRRGAALAAVLVLPLALPVVAWRSWPIRALAPFAPRVGLAAGVFPEGAVRFLAQAPRGGTVFNDYYWGGYLIWHLYPRYRVTIDGRAAVYGQRRLIRHVLIDSLRPGWRELLAETGARLALVRAQSGLAGALGTSPEWTLLYRDSVAAVFARRGGP